MTDAESQIVKELDNAVEIGGWLLGTVLGAVACLAAAAAVLPLAPVFLVGWAVLRGGKAWSGFKKGFWFESD